MDERKDVIDALRAELVQGLGNLACGFAGALRPYRPEAGEVITEVAIAFAEALSAFTCSVFSVTGHEPAEADHVLDRLAPSVATLVADAVERHRLVLHKRLARRRSRGPVS
jgi:hypothetical protein